MMIEQPKYDGECHLIQVGQSFWTCTPYVLCCGVSLPIFHGALAAKNQDKVRATNGFNCITRQLWIQMEAFCPMFQLST